MYDELIGELYLVASGVQSKNRRELLEQAADAIKELQKAVNFHKFNSEYWEDKYNSLADEKWIPVTERLPEKDVRVIVCASLPEGVHSDFIYEDGHWFVSTGVTHWMSLPEPPEEESNGV